MIRGKPQESLATFSTVEKPTNLFSRKPFRKLLAQIYSLTWEKTKKNISLPPRITSPSPLSFRPLGEFSLSAEPQISPKGRNDRTEVTTTFCMAPCTPIPYTLVLHPTGVSRIVIPSSQPALPVLYTPPNCSADLWPWFNLETAVGSQ